MSTVKVPNADRMMVAAALSAEGITATFADGYSGTVPFEDIPEVGDHSGLSSVELPNPYEIILTTPQNEQVELPWDFVRHYCDHTCQPRMELIASEGRRILGTRIRALREAAGWTQEALASASGIGRITLVQSFLNGSLTRLLDPDRVLRQKILEFVEKGDFGLASGEAGQGNFNRSWYRQTISGDEVTFDSDTFLLTKAKAEQLLAPPEPEPEPEPQTDPSPKPAPEPGPTPAPGGQQPLPAAPQKAILHLRGTVPPETWNMVGRRILTKLQQGGRLNVEADLTVEIEPTLAPSLKAEIQQALEDLKLDEQVSLE